MRQHSFSPRWFVSATLLVWICNTPSFAASSSISSPTPNVVTSSSNATLLSNSTEGAAAGIQATELTDSEGIAAYCQRLSEGKQQASALQAACEFSLSLRWKLPDVICDQETKRYQEGLLGDVVQRDTITAKVRYENGQEQYSQLAINGKPAQSALLESSGTWSEGEFATGLRTIFLPQTLAEFRFSKQENLHSRAALVFDYKVERKNNRSWYLKALSGAATFPGYRGRLWIDKTTLQLLRFERKLTDVENDFPIQQVDTVIDYADVDLADGTKFLLPFQAVNVTCPTVASNSCWHNQLSFKHWQKFAARTRILAEQEEPPAPAEIAPPVAISIPRSLEPERNTELLSEILIRQLADVVRTERDRRVVAALVRQNKPLPKLAPAPESGAQSLEAPSQPDSSGIPTFKSDVRVVLVPTVVRDSKGQAVDYLKKPDFSLFDNRKPQVISQFSLERPGTHLSAEEGPSRAGTAASSNAEARRFAAYVFDDIHSAWDDLNRARDAAKRHLTSLKPGDQAAIIALSGSVALDFTNNHAQLTDALSRIRPHPLTATGTVRCPDLSYAQSELIQNNDGTALEQATAEAMQCAFAGDSTARIPAERLARETAAQVVIAGRAESQRSFDVLRNVVRRIAQAPGQRSLVLVSPGFPAAAMEEEANEIIEAAQNAEIIINVLDPSGVSMQSHIEYGSVSTPADVLIDLSSATGGNFFRNRNDLDDGFRRSALPELLYVLGFSPQKLDGKFHALKVTVQRPEKLELQARRGYYALKPGN